MAMSFDEAKTVPKSTSVVHVGALLDLESPAGKASRTSISLALEDFYGGANGSAASTRVVMHFRDCRQDDVATASAGRDPFLLAFLPSEFHLHAPQRKSMILDNQHSAP